MLRSAARALLHKSHQLPEKRIQELTDYIQDNCHQHITENLLLELKEIDISWVTEFWCYPTLFHGLRFANCGVFCRVINEDYVPHGLLVVEYFARDNVKGLMRLEKIWREHFIKEMNPQHLPSLWSVDHYHDDERNYILDSEFLKKVKSVRNITSNWLKLIFMFKWIDKFFPSTWTTTKENEERDHRRTEGEKSRTKLRRMSQNCI